jgi:hypothetical protein
MEADRAERRADYEEMVTKMEADREERTAAGKICREKLRAI